MEFTRRIIMAAAILAFAAGLYLSSRPQTPDYGLTKLLKGEKPPEGDGAKISLKDARALADMNDTFARLAEAVLPSVVSVTTRKVRQGPLVLLPLGLVQGGAEPVRGMGSGAIISKDGLVVTNYHVIKDVADFAITTNDNQVTPPRCSAMMRSVTSAAATAATSATFVLLAGACTGGALEVDSTNPRYFRNRAGIVVMAGFHTWETLVDRGDSDPPDAFDYPAFLDALTAKGCNFIKLCACESLRDWCDAVKYFYPYIYNRPGPGNAADGKLKVDLTSFNAAYFARLRERAIEAGNRGMYVCVQLFQGWQITQKGYSTGSPGTYHPFNAANNINSIDGDTDNDGQVGETRDITWTAVYDLQKAYVRAVIDAVNDLDHVIYVPDQQRGRRSRQRQRSN